MGTAINRRRQMGQKKEKVLFELYNAYFDGTVNSVVDTGIKLWDGTHNKFKLEIEFDKINGNQLTLFTCKPDVSPYSGIRIRRNTGAGNSNFEFTVSDGVTITENPGGFVSYVNAFGTNITKPLGTVTKEVVSIIKDGDVLSLDRNGSFVKVQITNPKTNSLNLIIGCDNKGASETQRYYQGTIYKFKLTEL
jgi:hypothetical protein